MNVLVVEDERNLADAIVQILEDGSYNAEAVYDGRAGLAGATSGLYDAIVLDVMLPGMSGTVSPAVPVPQRETTRGEHVH